MSKYLLQAFITLYGQPTGRFQEFAKSVQQIEYYARNAQSCIQ